MTNSMSPEEIAEMSEDHQCSCKELEQLRADISEAYYLRDKAEGRYCTALGAIEQLHAAVKTAQELAATRLMEIRRLSKREKDLMDVIDSRDRALGFVPLDEVHASEPLPCALTQATLDGLIAEADKYILPVDVKMGAATFRKGVKVGTMLRGLKVHAERQTATAFSPGASRDTSPADLVGALQDVVHTDPGPVRAGRATREWHFDRYRGGKLMAQGVKVHAPNYADAYEKAVTMLFADGNKPTDELRLSERT